MSRPRRDRKHELETESQRAFAAALPPWIVERGMSDDYGIDREVEVFEHGEATGLTFKVQLKGTDKSGTSRRIKRSSLEYWRELDVPVLLVSYESSSGVLRSRWAHSIGADGLDKGAETMTIHMSPGGEINASWFEGLANDLRLVRQLRRGDVPVPVPVRVNLDKSVADQPLDGLPIELLHISRRGELPLRHANDKEMAIDIEIRADRISVQLPLQWASATIRTPIAVDTALAARLLARDVLLLIALSMRRTNLAVARSIAWPAGPRAALWGSYDMATELLDLFGDPATANHLIEVVRHLPIDTMETRGVLDIYLMALNEVSVHVDYDLFNNWSRELEEASRDEPDAGRYRFNLGYLHRTRGEHDRAAELLYAAAKRDPRYAVDELWLTGIAGTEWERGNYNASAEHYTKAIDQGVDPQRNQPLLADALLLAGRYGEASAALESWEPAEEERDRVGIIRTAVLAHIESVVAIDTQSRTPPTHQQLDDLASFGNRLPDIIELLRTTDALDPQLWDRTTNIHDLGAAFHPALIVAVALINDPAMWTAALLSALAAGQPEEMICAILNEGRLVCPDPFYEGVLALADEQPPEAAGYLRALLYATYEQNPVSHGMRRRMVHNPSSSLEEWVEHDVWLGGHGVVPPPT